MKLLPLLSKPLNNKFLSLVLRYLLQFLFSWAVYFCTPSKCCLHSLMIPLLLPLTELNNDDYSIIIVLLIRLLIFLHHTKEEGKLVCLVVLVLAKLCLLWSLLTMLPKHMVRIGFFVPHYIRHIKVTAKLIRWMT